jgi:hypothetical protein
VPYFPCINKGDKPKRWWFTPNGTCGSHCLRDQITGQVLIWCLIAKQGADPGSAIPAYNSSSNPTKGGPEVSLTMPQMSIRAFSFMHFPPWAWVCNGTSEYPGGKLYKNPDTKMDRNGGSHTTTPVFSLTSFVTCALFARLARTRQTSVAYFPGLPPLVADLAICLHPHSQSWTRIAARRQLNA